MSRVDLHLHTRHSDRSADWVFRRVNFPDSHSDPARLYDALRQRGMDFVTFTDHDSIRGCLEIADRPGVFLSEEITAQFPEDGVRIHVLAWGITEAQHAECARLRRNLYELQAYLASEKIAHAVAHPLFGVDGRLAPSHVERLLLLFRAFEGLNGLRDARFSETIRFIVSKLTPAKMEELAERHHLTPTHPEPWRKILTGGSDDHGGIAPATAWTETPRRAATPAEFLRAVTEGDVRPEGQGGSPLTVSHGIYNTAWQFFREKFKTGGSPSLALVEKAFSRFLEGRDPTEFSFGEKLGFLMQGIASGKIFELTRPGNASLWRELAKYFGRTDLKQAFARETAGIVEPERRAFVMANLIANQLAYRFFTRTVEEVTRGNFFESVQTFSALVPVAALLGPYLYAFQSQCPPRALLAGLGESLAGSRPPFLQARKCLWATDTLDDVNGVATTIRKMSRAALAARADLTILTCSSSPADPALPIKNFPPVGEFELPEYELQKLSFPPILPILDHVQREGFTEAVISTPGPTGLTALLAAKMLGLRTAGIYHTDFPQYVRILTDDRFMETLTWNFMSWFYGQFDLVYVNSEPYRRSWAERGIAPEKLRILPRGLDLTLFHPSRRDPAFWTSRGLRPGEIGVLYVGRVSKEKDLEVLVAAAAERGKTPLRFLVVGAGPYLAEMRRRLPGAIFTGALSGETLAAAYASADLFAFPSTTDTFGNVVLEAMASGLPCVVSDEGGPAELVAHGRTGLITKARDARALREAIDRLAADASLRRAMAAAARDAVAGRDWDTAFGRLWNELGSCPSAPSSAVP